MIAEGDDAFKSKMVFEGIDQEICLEQNAVVEAGNILISMMMGNVLQAFGGMDKLTTIKGQIKIKNFTALKQLPDWSKITTLGSITLDYLEDVSGTLLLPNARFETFGETAPQIEIIWLKEVKILLSLPADLLFLLPKTSVWLIRMHYFLPTPVLRH